MDYLTSNNISIMKNNIITLFFLAATLFAACKKEPVPDTPSVSTAPAYLLNEGSWGGNDASISLIDRNSDNIENNWFRNNNGRGIGDLAQDLIHYGGKLYVSVYTSNTVEVIDPATGKSIKQIDMGTRGPRYLAYHNGKIYVSCYDKSIVRIDTAALGIEASCPLSGMQPEQLCIIGDNMYVCNCWQYDANGNAIYDSTVSIVNLATFSETGKITVGRNPGRIKALDSHRFIVACAGDYGDAPAQTLIVDLANGTQQPLPVSATGFDIFDGNIYLYQTTYDAQGHPAAVFYKVNLATLQSTPILQQHTADLRNAYAINVDPATGNLFICNSPYNANADLYTFQPDGSLVRKVEGGILASKVVF